MNLHTRNTLTMVPLLLLALLGWAVTVADAASPRPNIVLILADDLGWQEPGFTGSDFCETPNLDRLARDGMVFRNAYASGGNCAPSRACLISGQYTPRHGVFAVGSTDRGRHELMRLVPIPNRSNMPVATATLGEAMTAAGYVTGMFGKCHLTDSKNGKNEQRGFDVVKLSQHGFTSEDPEDPKGVFSITAAACEFMEANKGQPFFAYLPHYAVHSRLQGRPATVGHFKAKTRGEKNSDPLLAACLADLDTSIGMLLKKLRDLGLEDNTLVLFTSDNGGAVGSQEPLRGHKGSYYDGGIRVPMIARWPGVVKPGSTCDVPVINVDFYPTFLAVAGSEPSASSVLDGANLLPLLRGGQHLDRDGIFWHFPGYLDGPVPRGRDPVFRTRPVSVIRRSDWKLHLYHEEWQLDGGREKLQTNNAIELYNLAEDPGEHRNLALVNHEKREELLTTLLAWFTSAAAPLPSQPNPAWDPQAAKAPSGKK